VEWAEENHETPQSSRCSVQHSNWAHTEPTYSFLCGTGMFIDFEIIKLYNIHQV